MTSGSFTDFLDQLGRLRDTFVEWLFAVLRPLEKCQELLTIKDSKTRMSKVLQLWTMSFVIAVVVDLPLYYPLGLGLKNIEFHIIIFLCLTFGLIASGFALNVGLRVYKIPSSFSEVSAIYNSCVMIYQPFLNLFTYFATYRVLSILLVAKKRGLPLLDSLHFFLQQNQNTSHVDSPLNIAVHLSSWILMGLTACCSTLAAIAIANHYRLPQIKAFSAVAFAITMLVPIVGVVQGAIVDYITFTYMSASSH